VNEKTNANQWQQRAAKVGQADVNDHAAV